MDTESLSGPDEYALYQSDRAAWIAYVAPRLAARLKTAAPEDRRIRWEMAGPELKKALRELANSC